MVCAAASAYVPGKIVWARRYAPSKHQDAFHDIAVDRRGNVYAVGQQGLTGAATKLLVAKYGPAGKLLWARSYRRAGWTTAWAGSVAVDRAGNVYLAGSTVLPGHSNDYLVAKYSAGGVRRWVKTYNGPSSDMDIASHIVVDRAGNATITGAATKMGGRFIVTMRYDTTGHRKWLDEYAGPGDVTYPGGMLRDAAGNVCITGTSTEAPDGKSRCVTVKYTAAGQRTELAMVESGVGEDLSGDAIGVYGSNVYVACTRGPHGTPSQNDVMLVKFTPAGAVDFERGILNAVGDDDRVNSMKLDTAGNVYVVGTRYINGGTEPSSKGLAVKFSDSGDLKWLNTYYNTTANLGAAFFVAAVDSSNRLFCGGFVNKPGDTMDLLAVSYRSSGGVRWTRRYDNPLHTSESCDALAISGSSALYLGGTVEVKGWTDIDALLIRVNR
jgi:hypothetical protein